MDWLQAILLGIVQGFTEFLPVSSSGHLVIFQKLLGIEHHDLAFDVAAHVGTVGSVLTVYRRLILRLLKKGFQNLFKFTNPPAESRLIQMVVLSSIPTAIIGLLFKDLFESLFSNLLAVGCCLMFTGTLLFFTRKRNVGEADEALMDLSAVTSLTWKVALLIGVAQSLAIAPGISRSGMTIAAALLLSVPGPMAAAYSFIIAIPAILGAAVLQLGDIPQLSSAVILSLALGFVVSYLSGILALRFVIRLVNKGRLSAFSGYLWVVGLLVIGWSFLI